MKLRYSLIVPLSFLLSLLTGCGGGPSLDAPLPADTTKVSVTAEGKTFEFDRCMAILQEDEVRVEFFQGEPSAEAIETIRDWGYNGEMSDDPAYYMILSVAPGQTTLAPLESFTTSLTGIGDNVSRGDSDMAPTPKSLSGNLAPGELIKGHFVKPTENGKGYDISFEVIIDRIVK